ncbi:MAG TPA: CPBP family intramembrane glutamic endopeptidase [Rhizomicrobium sp.]|jgi:hypothetical protein|nr:CPBP family intramembrane glutamic endopeptidase [Rhizomicrobium sp.]
MPKGWQGLMNSTITFVGGVLFCWLTERWNSIWPGFIIHAGLNLVWSLFALGENTVGGELGNLARLATLAAMIGLTWVFVPRGQLRPHRLTRHGDSIPFRR